MASDLEITLAVLVAVFGIATVAFLVYFIVTKCCRRTASHFVSNSRHSFAMPADSIQLTVLAEAALPVPAKDECVKPRYSCRYQQQTLDVFNVCQAPSYEVDVAGDAARLGLLAAAQHYYLELGGEARGPGRTRVRRTISPPDDECSPYDEIPRIEEVSVIPLGRRAEAALPAPADAAHIRPKSYCEASHSTGRVQTGEEIADVSQSMYISKFIGPSGGTIEMYGITLEIAANALSSEQKIVLGVLWSAGHQPKLAARQAALCPIVSCEPHGLQLRTAATLTLPHCAADVDADWTVAGLCSETPPAARPRWTRLADHVTTISRRHVRFRLDHFTLYTASGEPKNAAARKWVDLIAFTPLLTGSQFPIRVYCLNDYTDDDAKDTKKISRTEEKQGGKEVTSPQSLAFHNDGNDLCVEIDRISESWSLSGVVSKRQKLDFEQVWHATGPNCKFVLTSDKQPPTVECSIDLYQLEHQDHKERLTVSQERQQSVDTRIDPERMMTVFPSVLVDVLMKMLDPDVVAGNNWVALAEHLNLPLREAQWLKHDHRTVGRSPTVYLLNHWVTLGKSLDEFQATMETLERHDVVEEIGQWKDKNPAH